MSVRAFVIAAVCCVLALGLIVDINDSVRHVVAQEVACGEEASAEGEEQRSAAQVLDDGTVHIIGYAESGKRVGYWKWLWPSNGKVRQEGKYVAGKRHGNWKWYSKNGNKRRSIGYDKGIEDGFEIEWGRDGVKLYEANYCKGTLCGVVMAWHADGKRAMEAPFNHQGEMDGCWRTWYENGKLFTSAMYADGKLHGEWREWHGNGTLHLQGKYSEGEKHGVWREWNELGELVSEQDHDIK